MPDLQDDILDGHLFGADQPCFGCGPSHPNGFRLRFERDGADLLTRFTPTEHHQGPLGIMHGGLVSTLADELAVWTVVAAKGTFAFTASFSCRLHKPVRIGKELLARGVIKRDRRRVVDVDVNVDQGDEHCFSSSFRCVLLDEQATERMLQRPLPEAWKRFVRRT